ncbi:response regulator [Quatrionicoccus australiensis]|uniref:response regulator n=1 Tax=Quatrionicoccus australiensis TaxID=138118 RepID=UPI001CF8B06E|nr:response regulator [Quatrionicoccus australiensis]UCV16005.1 Cache 3/Cache 2 fusion domain-containing protein [Quatrionicoccus australiensis]
MRDPAGTICSRLIELADSQVIISRSDLAGRIVYANADFIEVSGYSEDELLGQPHRIIRHPDMPAAVFTDLWADISSGRPWVGVIKNRSKSGNAYWVEAHVSPIREKEAIVGYLSIRRKASATQIAAAEATYAAMREAAGGSPVFKHGVPHSAGGFAHLRLLFANAPVAFKLILSSLLVALLVLGTLAFFLARNVTQVLDQDARERLKHDVGLVYSAFSARIESTRREAIDHGRTFFERLHWGLGEKTPVSRAALEKLARQTNTGESNSIQRFLPDLRTIGSVFVRTPEGFRRVMSNLKDESGNEVVGSFLEPGHPALDALLAGKPSSGSLLLFGREYMTDYRPILDASGEVIGATFVGIDLAESLEDLKERIRGLSVGKTGYYFIVDATPGSSFGNVILHPFKEGQKIPAIYSSDGKDVFQEIIRQGQGELVYSWRNIEAGETGLREKLVRFETLSEPRWVVAGGSALDEFTALSSHLSWFLVAGGLAMAAAIFLIVLWLLRLLVLNPLHTKVLPAFQAISAGNFSTRLDICGEDEISQVMLGLESLQNRLALDAWQSQTLASAREAALREAESLSQTRTQFLANMSHEIRTPMNAVIGLAYLLQKGELGAREREYVGRIEGAGKLLLAIINDILDFSKIDAGELHLEETGFKLDDILENLSLIVHDRVREKNLVLEYVVAADVPQALCGDPLRLSQILINLVGNAVKFTAEGAVTVFVAVQSQDEAQIRLGFRIQDTGIGMSPEQSAKVFQAFAQADTSVTRRFGGTGLGLVICKRLVELMGGQIQVDSSLGRGSVFSFDVLLKRDRTELSPAPLLSHHILVVDDNDLARMVLTRILQKRGCVVEARSSGDAALAALESSALPFDFVLLDLNMPGMNGLELARQIRSNFGRQQKLILVTSADVYDEDYRDAFGDFEAVVEKPVTAAKITEMLARMANQETVRDAPGNEAAEQLSCSLSGMRIMVAEDVPTNQLIMRDLLESLGARVDVADNGHVVLQLLAREGASIDLILMDIQMPVMGGIEACQRIRSGQVRSDIPIIALTAHAMEEERQRCLGAGMNDFLTKPIEPDALISLIKRWRPQHADPVAAKPSVSAALPDVVVPELPGIDVEDGLSRMLNRPAFYKKVLLDFRSRFIGETGRILAALEAGQQEDAIRRAHSLKGTSGTIGATRLAALARELEHAIRDGKSGGDDVLADVEKELALVLDGIERGFATRE